MTRRPSRESVLASDLLKRSGAWRAAAARAARLSRGRTDDVSEAQRLVDDYRMLAHDLATARRLLPHGAARDYLETAYANAHAAVHKPAAHLLYGTLGLFREQIPAAVTRLRPHILWVTLLFVGSLVAGYWMVTLHPELIGLFASPELIATVERGELWTEGLLNVVPSSVLSVQILTNNIVVSVFAFCAGFLFGLGTFYIVALNGLMLGAVFAFTGLHGLDDELFGFVVAHGCVEISCMCLSGAAGAAIGEALVRPGAATRGEAFQAAAAVAGRLLFACVLLLIGAGIIEGYVSPDPDVPLRSRIAIGVGYWLLMIALLRGWLFGRRTGTQAVSATSAGAAG